MGEPSFFPTPAELRAWFETHADTEKELLVGFYRKGSGRPSITWAESVDQALCFGWIDGVRRTIDEESYCNRFTPRRPNSNWSDVNVRRMKELIAQRLVQPAGLAAFERRPRGSDGDGELSSRYSYERKTAALTREYEKKLKANRKAWTFFQAQPPGYRRLMAFYVLDAKKEETRLKRLERLIEESAAGRRVG